MIKSFIKPFLIFSFIIATLIAVGCFMFFDSFDDKGIIQNSIFHFALTLISGMVLTSFIDKDPSQFQIFILGNFTGKIILSIVYFIITYKTYNDSLIIFVLSFFLVYFIFTIFEVSFLVRKLKEKGKN